MKNMLIGKRLVVVTAIVVSGLFLTGCVSRSPVASQIINIPPQYSEKMYDMLDATGYQQGVVIVNTFPRYNKAIVDVSLSNPMIENSTLDYAKTGYIVEKDEDVNGEVINYAQNSYSSAFYNSQSFSLTGQPGHGVLKINVFITQVIPNDVLWGTLGNIPSPTWIISKPISLGLHSYSDSSGGAVAMETIISDSVSGQVLAVFVSREKDAWALFNTHGFTMTASCKAIIDMWSADLVSTLDQLKSGSTNLTAAQIPPLMNAVQ